MALKPENPVVGGTVLRRAAIQSPNYSPGVSGWTIKQDGSAEFNNLTIRGTFNGTDFIINASGAFFYAGIPAAGNLIVSIASVSGTDQFGNTYPQGIQIGESGAQAQVVLIPGMAGGSSEVQFPLPGASLSNVPNIAGGSGAGGPELLMSGPALSAAGQTDWTQIAMFANPGGGGQASCQFVYVNSSGTAVLVADYNGSGWVFTTAGPVTVQGSLNVGGTTPFYDGITLTVGNGVTSNCVFNPKMATPPNAAAVAAGTATLAQTEAFCNGLYTSMKNRGMFN